METVSPGFSNTQNLSSGYDLPVLGLNNGWFLTFHISAITCILLSFICVLTTVIWSFKMQEGKGFFLWAKGQRLVIYLAICDGGFNISHIMDHLSYLLSEDHVQPPAICSYFGFTLVEFISAQSILVFIIATSACYCVFSWRKVNFGVYDWRLITAIFGLPFIQGCVFVILDGLGHTGAFCFFDGVKGQIMNVFFTTTQITTIVIINSICYILICIKTHKSTIELRNITDPQGTKKHLQSLSKKTIKTARTSLMFVSSFLLQWWVSALYGTWQMVENPPQLLFQGVVIFSNLGGVFNFIVFLRIRAKDKNDQFKTEKLDISKSRE